MGSLTLSVFEITFLFICAIVVGIVIHFFITSRRNLDKTMKAAMPKTNGLDEWKLKYFNEMEARQKEIDEIKQRLLDADESNKIYQMEIEELRRQNKKLGSEPELSKSIKPQNETKPDYLDQLRQAQESLLEHNRKISQLLDQVDVIKESEEKTLEIQKSNKELNTQINDLKYLLEEKEEEINKVRQRENITSEMNSMLDNAYSEFNVLQGKLQKLELQLSSSKMINIEYDDLKESHYKMTREFDETRNKLNHYLQENQNLQIQLEQTENKLSEVNMQRQQLQKKVSYLEELTNDLQQMSEANKKLEHQIKRMGELESMLNVVAEERDKLRNRQMEGS